MSIRPIFAWYDCWIGLFWDQRKRKLYVFPLPMIGIVIQLGQANPNPPHVPPATAIWPARHIEVNGFRYVLDEDGLVAYLHRQWDWSKRTFGPERRTKGIIQHITKELREIEAKPDDLSEWIDVAILAMDGFWRHGGKPEDLMPTLQAKQDKNFARKWPTPTSEDEAVEHDRSEERA